MSDNIKVVVKVRPLIPREIEDKLGYQWRVNNNTLYQIDQNGRDCGPCYTFDKVYNKDTKTSDVYNDIAKPIVEAATAGFNGTIFAYGQTSSGKTYTMTGTKDAPGIIPLAVINLFDIIKNIPDRDFLVRVSYVEIYNETLTDLLDLKKNIKICETFQGVKVDATEKLTTSPEEVLEVMREGKANRQTGATNMNEESSRSHSIFQITIESREHIEGEEEVGSVNVSQLNLVDLAGSERSGQTGATGLRFKEGTHINKSLSALALVIKQLSEDSVHVNYRDSKLTRILQNSLGGNAKTSIICAVTPAAVEETISTLQFANRAKAIKNSPAVNAVATNVTMIQTLTKQLSALKTQLESKKNVEQDNYNLQKQIGALQRVILNGFAQRSSTDITGARRKLHQPRRVTISTLHPIEEDPVPTIPKFCTPSLKYNPMSIANVSDFVPIQSASSLSSVTEEVRLITPPPTNRKVNLSDEIIELDSDDDNSIEVQTCSPYHKCYQSSKTPPCVLRKNAKQAEKNLKDIVELTEREKIYTPNIVELMEKLESKSSTIAKLEDKLNRLGSLSKEKDLEMEKLRSNVNRLEDEIKSVTSAKADLEAACKDYNTKLTDWEVSYETLKKKAKSREDELLSLLQEHEAKKKHEKIGKLASKAIERELTNFMDLSRDISLVNSDNENSIINIEDKQLFEVSSFKNNVESEMSLKDQTILELKSDLESQKLKIESLETINKELQETISSYKEKLSYIENENSLHKSTIDNLNNTIENQKTVIENINADVVSYNSVIQELQIKLAKREKIGQSISDFELEAMITNEEMFIANNENMKNILQSFKAALNSRNEEIKNLKSSLDKGQADKIIKMEEELDSKKKEISSLIEEVEHLKAQTNENVVVVDKLLEEKNNLLHVEQQLQTQLTEIQKEKDLLNDTIAQQNLEITDLKQSLEKLKIDLEEKEHEILSIKEANEEEIRNMSQKITDLEKNVKTKDEIIASLRKTENETQENLERVQSNIHKFNKIMTLFAGNILEVPEKMNDLVSALNVLGDHLTSLETLALNTIEEKKQVTTLLEQKEKEIDLLQSYVSDLSNAVDSFYTEYETLAQVGHNNETIINNDVKEEENNTLSGCEILKYKITNLITVIKSTQLHLNQTLHDKDKELNELNLKYENKQTELEAESVKATKYMNQIEELTNKRDKLLHNILEKVTDLTSECYIENSISCEFNSNPENTYEQINLTLDKIYNHILIIKSERETKYDNIESILSDARNEIKLLTEENIKLIHDISNLESSNNTLTSEIKRIQDSSKTLTKDLEDSNNLLNQLQQNLAAKSNEFDDIELKAMEWKEKFRNLEILMKEQIDMLEIENLELKSKCSELELQDKQQNGHVEPKEFIKKPNVIDKNSPPSLLKICCDSIIDAISTNEDDKTISSATSITDDTKSIPCAMKHCQCKDLEADLELLKTSNDKLKAKIEELENENAILHQEQEEVQKEVQLLIENTYELQKKLLNHRTNLSTLTATTYAENKSLSSKVKFLQHHHNRFHIVCQRDIPDFKKQLQDLLILLKSENLGKLNDSIKRYSLPNALESVSFYSQYKNESTIDGDLLMLDTNITLTTCDNTLSHDQTCFDVTQVCTYNEVACQTNFNEISKSNVSYPQIKTQSLDENKILEALESLREENGKLREVVDEYSRNKKSKCVTDTQSSPIKISSNYNDQLHINNNEGIESCKSCKHEEEMRIQEETHKKEIEVMNKKLTDLESQKIDIETKYQNLSLEVPSTELLVRKLGTLENDNCTKQNEIDKLNSSLKKKCEELKTLQEENDLLSNQVIESISEVDDLKKEHDTLKEINNNLSDKFSQLEKEIERLKSENTSEKSCTECTLKDDIINTLKNNVTNSHQKLDRSYSDSDSSSRYNKICTLQNELHAGKKDCIELKEQVTTIKNHLERSDLSMGHAMDLDDSISDAHMCSFNQDFDNAKSQDNKYNMPDIPEERSLDNHAIDKIECLNYYIEKTSADKESLNCDIKILDVMKMLYEYIENKHANEIENLNNKLRDFEESKTEIQMQLNKLNSEQTSIKKQLKEKDTYLETLANVVSQIRNNIDVIKSVDFKDIVTTFSDKFLMKVDKEFGFASTAIFEFVIQQINDKHKVEIGEIRSENEEVNNTIQDKNREIEALKENLSAMKLQLNEKESELNLLQRQKEKIHEISTAVTLDIVQKEKELKDQVIGNYNRLLESKILNKEIDITLPTIEIMKLIFENVFTTCNSNNEELQKDKNALVLEVDELKKALDVKDKELQLLNGKFEEIQNVNKNITTDLSAKEQKLQEQITLHNNLDKKYNNKVEENNANVNTIQKLTEEIFSLKADISNKEALITSLEDKLNAINSNIENQMKVTELLQSSANLQSEIDHLKSINDVILKEKETYAEELEKANAVIKQNKIDFEKLTSDILVLKETVKENSNVTENLRLESKRLLEENSLLQTQLQEKCKEYSRIEDNIKKHEKTAEIQSGIIIRLKKQKQDDEKLCLEKDQKIEELTQACKSLETQSKELTSELQATKDKMEELVRCKHNLESRILELESDVHVKPRLSIDAIADSTRRRRQSIHDSKRMFSDDIDEHMKMEAVFKTNTKVDDLFMDVDESSSNRSTPLRLSKGRDSLLSKNDQNSRDEGGGESVSRSRRRRQSVHDLRRSVTDHSRESSQNNSMESEVTQLKKQLSSCQQELEELKERYKELDEECETCAEYLKERDEQCLRLKKEKRALENTVTDLQEKLKNNNPNYSSMLNTKNNLVHASVNTDEDWTNLHSLVVDRMSFDAEVEKNKKLMKTVEELRFKKLDLKKTIAKMQKALEKNTVKDNTKELEATKAELAACKQELEELKEKYKELDEECETCAEYLRERDEQCRKLKETKSILEAKLQEYQDLSNITHSVRKKRQSVHDKNRCPSTTLTDASTDTNDDFLSYQADKDDSSLRALNDTHAKEIKRLKAALEKLSQQKATLEQQLVAASATPLYVATGSAIIQNQQLTDVMKENQKLKKINAKLVTICKKRGKSLMDSNRENEDPLNN